METAIKLKGDALTLTSTLAHLGIGFDIYVKKTWYAIMTTAAVIKCDLEGNIVRTKKVTRNLKDPWV